MAKIALGVTSSISIYKACEIVRAFEKEGCEVQVIMTRNATRFISPLLFSTLSRHKAIVDLFEDGEAWSIGHVALADEIALLLVAPATANIIAKFASGVADDFLSTFFLAVRSPVLIAPAMNEAMYLHAQTQANIQKLKAAGVEFIEPEKGYLACDKEGWGRLAAVEKIVEEGLRLLRRSESLRGKTVLVTAGPTREFLDPVRFLSNRSSGKMGYELAAEALTRGAEVILVSGPSSLCPPFGATVFKVQTAEDMKAEIEKHFSKADMIIMAAAVSDFAFSSTAPQKIKKGEIPERISLVRTRDILSELGRKKGRSRKILIGFAADTDNVMKNAQQKLKDKNLDLIVANDVAEEGTGFESDFNKVVVISSKGVVLKTEKRTKREISRLILNEIEVLLGKKA